MNNDNRIALSALVEARLHRMKLDQPYLVGPFGLESLARKAYSILEAEQASPADHIEKATEIADTAILRAIGAELYQLLHQSKDSPLVTWLCGFVLSQLRNHIQDTAGREDTAQEALKNIFAKLDTLQHPESFYFWSLQIVRNARINYYRKIAASAKMEEPLDDECDVEVSDPSWLFFTQELREFLLHHINSLRPTRNTAKQKCILLKFHFEDWSINELAAELKIDNQKVSHLLDEAHKRLRNDAQLMKKLLDWKNDNSA